jgi:hypothetical protein
MCPLYLYCVDSEPDSALSAPLVTLLESTVIPQMQLLRNFEPLRSALKIEVFPPLIEGHLGSSIDFFDVAASDAWCDSFQSK